MSSSDHMGSGTASTHAMPWALEELPMPDIFPIFEDRDEGSVADPAQEVDLHQHYASERTRVEHESHARGYAEGERHARAEAEASLRAALTALTEAAAIIQLHEARWISNAEENIAALAVAVARHIVAREVTIDPSGVHALVSRAMLQLPVDQPIVVRLHPDDVSYCDKLIVADAAGRSAEIRWVPDQSVMRGGCLVEGRERIIDGRIDTSLERAYLSIGNLQA